MHSSIQPACCLVLQGVCLESGERFLSKKKAKKTTDISRTIQVSENVFESRPPTA